MKNTAVKKLSMVLVLLAFLGTVAIASAQTISTPYVSTGTTTGITTTGGPCTNLTYTLSYGKHDSSTAGQVSVLQTFLYNHGYLSVTPTGYFGPLTLRAVKAFQRASASGAVDGIVGVQTRAHIMAASCGVNTPVTPIGTAPTIINGFAIYQGSVGQTVTLPGSGFTADSVLHFGNGAITSFSVNSTGTAITFTIPSYIGPYCPAGMACPMYAILVSNGSYPIYVENKYGKSNTVAFNVVNSPSPFPVAQ